MYETIKEAVDTLIGDPEAPGFQDRLEAWALIMGNLNPAWEIGEWEPDEELFAELCDHTGLLR